MMRPAVLALVLAACYRAGDTPACAIACDPDNPCPTEMTCFAGRCHAQGDLSCAPGDARSTIDVPSGSGGSACYGTGDLQLCFEAPPSGSIGSAWAVRQIDTTIGSGCTIVNGPVVGPSSVCVIAAATITIPNGVTISATGARALVLVADDAIRIDGTLSVASTLGGTAGAGGLLCPDDDGGGGAGAGGGAGGSFGSLGGSGGNGSAASGGSPPSPPGPGVHGGCAGGLGGADPDGGIGGASGAGGGAVYVIAKSSLALSGLINASGAGGGGGPVNGGGGGGGGGAGGYIGLDAPMIANGGVIVAAGGGGGGGGYTGAVTPGQPGSEAMGCARPTGGSGPNDGGTLFGPAGGAGSIDTSQPGGNGESARSLGFSVDIGGGGGGGGAGVVRMFGQLSGNAPCPQPTP